MNSSAEEMGNPGLTKAEIVIEDSEPEPAPQVFIDWEAHDPEDSMNWAPRKKWKTVSIVSCMAAITSLGSSIMAPATPQIMREFESTNYELAVFVVSIGVLGYGIGPLVLSPLSEIYGRAPVYHITNVLFVIFAVACAVAPSLSSLIGFRFLVGLAASVPASVGGGTIADLFVPNERGKAASIYGFGVLLGVSIRYIVSKPLGSDKISHVLDP
jgi:MFS family permease